MKQINKILPLILSSGRMYDVHLFNGCECKSSFIRPEAGTIIRGRQRVHENIRIGNSQNYSMNVI